MMRIGCHVMCILSVDWCGRMVVSHGVVVLD